MFNHGLVYLIIFFSLSVAKVYAEDKIFYAKGDVLLDGRAVEANESIKTGQILETKINSLAIIEFGGGSKIRVEENSQLKIQALNDEKNGSVFELSLGSLIGKSRKMSLKKDMLRIRAKTTSFAVRGTKFFIGIDNKISDESDIWMCVESGEVMAKADTEKIPTLVKAGEGIVVQNSTNTSKPQYFPWTTKINWEVEKIEQVKINKDILEKAYKNPLEKSYD